ncbi:hypothetical protein [Bacillus testis]|uniref:hypothetical protein n=1 Tax=Bacillus testis TaxID=1622072 RepID=UPI00067ED055|nr:hypothetical protein [Bacillus testis]
MSFFTNSVIGLFLYFPKDKREYIPAGITFALFLAAAIVTMILIIRHSRKEEANMKEIEQTLIETETKHSNR